MASERPLGSTYLCILNTQRNEVRMKYGTVTPVLSETATLM